jgi:HlyD family secretion protein
MGRVLSLLVVFSFVAGGGLKSGSAADEGTTGKPVVAPGTIEPEETTEVCAPVPGTIVSFGADPHAADKTISWGSKVEPGTVLAQIDRGPYITRVDAAKAACDGAEAGLAKAKVELKIAETRKKAVRQSQPKADAEIELAELNCQAAKAAVMMATAALAQARAALKQSEINLEGTTIKSPVKGVVIDRRVNVGQMVSQGPTASLFIINSVDRLYIWTSVKEADIARIHEKQPARFTVDAFPGKVFKGSVSQIRLNATMTQNVVTYTVVVAISAEDSKKLLPYLTANVKFE